jgi:rhodanese-related sulfurtransferase
MARRPAFDAMRSSLGDLFGLFAGRAGETTIRIQTRRSMKSHRIGKASPVLPELLFSCQLTAAVEPNTNGATWFDDSDVAKFRRKGLGMAIVDLDVATVRNGVEGGRFMLIDVREPHEFAARRIDGAVNRPLSRFDPADLPDAGDKTLVFMCAGGVRSKNALEQCRLMRLPWDSHLAGGINAWIAAGGPTV